MAPAAKAQASQTSPLVLVCGEEDFLVKKRARELYAQWTQEMGGMDHEIIDAAVGNSGEALKAIGRLRESLNTLPFFGAGKVVWFKDCSFLGEDRVSGSSAVTEALAELGAELKEFKWQAVRLIISAGKADKRRSFFKTLDKAYQVEVFEDWSADRNWMDLAETRVIQLLKAKGQPIADKALAELIARVGPNAALLESETEKVSLHAGAGKEIQMQDVVAVCARNKTAQAFALGEALAERNLPKLLRCLDEELWEIRLNPKGSSEIGVLYGLISKVRSMLLLKQVLREGWVRADAEYNSFKKQLSEIPREKLPGDKRYDPTSINAFVLFKVLPHVKRYTEAELVRAMELLLECNRNLVTSGLDETLVLQKALVQIVGNAAPQPAPSRSRF